LYLQLETISAELQKREALIEEWEEIGLTDLLSSSGESSDIESDTNPPVHDGPAVTAEISPVDMHHAGSQNSISALSSSDYAAASNVKRPTPPTNSAVHLEVLHLRALRTFLEEEFQELKEKAHHLLLNNTITFDLLWLLYPEGSEVTCRDSTSGQSWAFKV
jgi:hypothetical protein